MEVSGIVSQSPILTRYIFFSFFLRYIHIRVLFILYMCSSNRCFFCGAKRKKAPTLTTLPIFVNRFRWEFDRYSCDKACFIDDSRKRAKFETFVNKNTSKWRMQMLFLCTFKWRINIFTVSSTWFIHWEHIHTKTFLQNKRFIVCMSVYVLRVFPAYFIFFIHSILKLNKLLSNRLTDVIGKVFLMIR